MAMGSAPLTVAALIFILVGTSIAAKETDDSSEDNDLPSLAECRAHVAKALDRYWGSGDDDDNIDEAGVGGGDDGPGKVPDQDGDDEEDDDEKDKNEPVAKDDSEVNQEEKDDDKQDDSDDEGHVEDQKSKQDHPDDEDDDDDDDDQRKLGEGERAKDQESADRDDEREAGEEEIEKEVGGDERQGEPVGEESSASGESQEEITQAEVEELASADDFVHSEDEVEQEELEDVEVPQTGRDHIDKIMDITDEPDAVQKDEAKLVNGILKDVKRLYDQTIKPIEKLYKYSDISTRRFADAEIYSQPMVLFVGPWNSGKSTIINYLLDVEGTELALDTGPASAGSQFIVLTHADKVRRVDGTELAADWRFAGIQKFGQGFIDALVGVKMPRLLLEKITIVEAPGIRESQKSLNYPIDDSLQWFIDRADLIYVVFDPAKLEMGHEMELLMDQLKGREKYLRFLVNKADTVDTENIMKVTSQLFWTLSPMLSTQNVPVSYSVSLWSKPYQDHADAEYLSDQEVTMLRDLKKHTIDKLVENKLAHARRHAVTVRNHAKLVDCYLTHYYKHKTLFANKNKVANEIINNPDKYKIFESLSMLNNVSRYDLPNPEIYKEFFKVTPLYDFKQLKNTCSYFKGCPLDKLNICIAYDLPQLLGKYRKNVKDIREAADEKEEKSSRR